MSGVLTAQNMTSSPFSRYAYGDLNENVPTGYRAMGGVGYGMRSNKAINSAQPASYTACDSLTFMFDIAASIIGHEMLQISIKLPDRYRVNLMKGKVFK